jgi:hypothetical protein
MIRAAVKSAILKHKRKVIGILPCGGTILKSPSAAIPSTPGTTGPTKTGQYITCDLSAEILAHAKKLGIDAGITVGATARRKSWPCPRPSTTIYTPPT